MITPPFLKKGDKIAFVCTARKFSESDAQIAIQLANSWGLKVVLGATIGLDNFQLGGSDVERATDLQNMINDPSIKAIWCARGGYGTVRIIDLIDFKPLFTNPKWIIGFSDVTVLHSHLHTLNLSSLHAIMPFSVEKASAEAKESLRKSLFGEDIQYRVPVSEYNIQGTNKGVIVGGNLSILYSLLGSESSIDTTDKILFIEDLDEYLYHVDRMMMNLKRNGYFKNIKGVIVGGMTDMHDNAIPFGRNASEIILDALHGLDIPVCFDFPAGHLTDNRALVLGKEIELVVNSDFVTVTYL